MDRINTGHLAYKAALDHFSVDLQASDDVLGVQVTQLLHSQASVPGILHGMDVVSCAGNKMHTSALGQLHNKLQITLQTVAAVFHNTATTMFFIEKNILFGRLQSLLVVETDVLLAGIGIQSHIPESGHTDLGLQFALEIRRRWAVEVLEIEGHMFVGQSTPQEVRGNRPQH